MSAPDRGVELPRGLGLWDTSLLVLGLVIGGGIFLTPAGIAKAVPSETWILGLWIVGGLLAITSAAAGCTSAGLVPAPRIVYALARDGLFPRPFARVHPRFKTPSFGIVVQAVWMSLLCLSGRYEQLYTYATFFVILAYAATGIALFVFRRRRPDLERPYRCWGYPVVPFVFVASTLLLAVNTVREQPVETLAGIGILLLGLPFYFWMRRRPRETS